MGYSANSYVVFGLKVSKDMIRIEKKVRSCNHNVDTEAKFCPECGKPMYRLEYEDIVDEGYYKNKIGYFTSSGSSTETGILGFAIAKTIDQDTDYHVIPQPQENLIKELKALLTKHDIKFEDNQLKAYLYTYHSY